MTPGCERLIPSLPAALAGWYGDPLPAGAGESLMRCGQERARRARRRGHSALCGELEALVGARALGRPLVGRFEALAGSAAGAAEQALVSLVQGQLLFSRRLRGANEALERGFELARDQFLPADFFTVMKRHELLGELPLYASQRPPQSLADLLREAAVIRRLRGRRRVGSAGDGHADTVG